MPRSCRLQQDDDDNDDTERLSSIISSFPDMLFIVLGSAVAAVLGFTFARKSHLDLALQWTSLQLRYNAMAIKAIFMDHLQAGHNKTELPRMPGRVAIVTGGSRGIGTEVVRMLLKCDMEVIIACRRTSAGEKAVKAIRESGVESGKTNVMELDNSSLNSVKKFIDEFTNNYEKLDILINNAGIMFTPYGETVDGYEEQYAVNYLSHFLLTVSLIPLLKKASTPECYSRIVNVSSCAHLLGKIHFDDINLKKNFLTGEAYAQSKLAQLLFTKYLARFFEEKNLPIRINAVHPGIVNTELFDISYHKYLRIFWRFVFKKPKDGATPIVYTAVSPQIEKKSGLYISNCMESSVNSLANDKALQDRLFDVSLKQVKLQNITT